MIRSARVAVLEIKSTKITPKTPFRRGKKFSEVSFYVVMAKEKDEWKSFWTIVHGSEGLEKKPSLGEFVEKVA